MTNSDYPDTPDQALEAGDDYRDRKKYQELPDEDTQPMPIPEKDAE